MASDALTAEERFTTLINSAIAAKEVKSYPAWSKMLKDTKAREKRQKEASKEAGEAEALAKELGVHDKLYGTGKGKAKGKKEKEAEGEEALRALIQQRGAARMANTLASIEAKYATADNKKSKKRKSLSPSDNSEDSEKEKRKKAKRNSMPTEEDFQKIQAGLGKKGRKST